MGRYSSLPRKLEILFSVIRLWRIWRKHPELRLYQLLDISRVSNIDPFYAEDNELLEAVEIGVYK